jgi:type I restriction enzyme M protein
VRQKLIETGAVDVMIDIRGNFFYTRTVPCQLWFFDRAKEKDDARRNQVLMLDARNIFRKVSRSVCDFSPEQQKNIAAIIWLYRGQSERFIGLVESYLQQAIEEGEAASTPLRAFEETLGKLARLMEPFAKLKRGNDPLAEPWSELAGSRATLKQDIEAFDKETKAQAKKWPDTGRENAGLNAARIGLHPLADRCRDLTKEIDLAAKLAGRAIDIAVKELDARESDTWDTGDVNKARKAVEAARAEAVEALRRPRYFVRQADWLQERFPEAKLNDVEGLVKLVDRATIKTHDWSVTPGRYVGVAPEEQDEDFDFEEALRAIHIDLKGLNEEAAELAARIAKNFEELGA